MKKLLLTLLWAALPLSAWAKLPVVASFSILADITREIGGDRVEVVSLVGPAQDAHVFQPRPTDVKTVGAARVFVVNGLGFEGWMGRLSKTAGFNGVLIEASRGIRPLGAEHKHTPGEAADSHAHGRTDPHAWHDPARVQQYVRNIEAGLSKADPQGRTYYRQRAQAYAAKLSALDSWAAQQFAAVPQAKRKVLTSHDAFAYLAARYQLRFMAPQGVSTDSEASAKSVANLIRQVRQDKVQAVFVENMADPRLLQQLAREAGVRVGGKLYSDSLAASGEAGSYLGMFRHNVASLTSAMK